MAKQAKKKRMTKKEKEAVLDKAYDELADWMNQCFQKVVAKEEAEAKKQG